MSATQANVDPDKLNATVEQVFGYLGGAVISSMIYLGDHLGLYRALADSEEPLSSAQLAQKRTMGTGAMLQYGSYTLELSCFTLKPKTTRVAATSASAATSMQPRPRSAHPVASATARAAVWARPTDTSARGAGERTSAGDMGVRGGGG